MASGIIASMLARAEVLAAVVIAAPNGVRLIGVLLRVIIAATAGVILVVIMARIVMVMTVMLPGSGASNLTFVLMTGRSRIGLRTAGSARAGGMLVFGLGIAGVARRFVGGPGAASVQGSQAISNIRHRAGEEAKRHQCQKQTGGGRRMSPGPQRCRNLPHLHLEFEEPLDRFGVLVDYIHDVPHGDTRIGLLHGGCLAQRAFVVFGIRQ